MKGQINLIHNMKTKRQSIFKDSKNEMNCFRDNLTLWTSNDAAAPADEHPDHEDEVKAA